MASRKYRSATFPREQSQIESKHIFVPVIDFENWLIRHGHKSVRVAETFTRRKFTIIISGYDNESSRKIWKFTTADFTRHYSRLRRKQFEARTRICIICVLKIAIFRMKIRRFVMVFCVVKSYIWFWNDWRPTRHMCGKILFSMLKVSSKCWVCVVQLWLFIFGKFPAASS